MATPRPSRSPSRTPLPFPIRDRRPAYAPAPASTVAPVPAASPASSTHSEPSPQDILIAGVEVATFRYGATCQFARSDADLLAHWPHTLALGAALVVGCVASDPAHDGAQLTLAPRLKLPIDRDDAERARMAVQAVAARLAAYARDGRTGRFVWRAWGKGYRLMEARRESGMCPRCLGERAMAARARREQKAHVCRAVAQSEPGTHVFINPPGGSVVERQAI